MILFFYFFLLYISLNNNVSLNYLKLFSPCFKLILTSVMILLNQDITFFLGRCQNSILILDHISSRRTRIICQHPGNPVDLPPRYHHGLSTLTSEFLFLALAPAFSWKRLLSKLTFIFLLYVVFNRLEVSQ